MKAEHRKELETNLLADRMGSFINRMKGGPQRRTLVYIVLVLLAIGIGVIVYIYLQSDRAAVANSWVDLEFGHLAQIGPEAANAKIAAELEYYHFVLWNQATSNLGSDTSNALRALDLAEALYDRASREQAIKDKKDWAAEVDYALALIEETRAAIDVKRLESARTKYEQVARDYEKTPFGELASRRKKELTDNLKKYKEFYTQMNARLYKGEGGETLKSLDDKQRKAREKGKSFEMK